MESKYPNLCAPITLGRTTFCNRMFSTPMGGTDYQIVSYIERSGLYAKD